MREPKFRAWWEKGKRMLDIAAIDFLEKEVKSHANVMYRFDDIELMQFTGLKDKYGKEVFEGDFIRDSDDFEALVIYDEKYVGFGLDYQPAFKDIKGLTVTFDELKNEYQNTFEVIGNKYEDPELLKGE